MPFFLIRNRLYKGGFFDIFIALEKYVDWQEANKNGSTESSRHRLRGSSAVYLPDGVAAKCAPLFMPVFHYGLTACKRAVFWVFKPYKTKLNSRRRAKCFYS